MKILRTYRYLFLLVLVSRLGMVWFTYPDVERIYNGDSHLYEQYAMSMLDTGSYLSDGYGTKSSDPFADMIRPPGLPVVVYLVYSVFGPVVGPWAVSVLSALMSLVVLYLMLVFFRLVGLDNRWPVLIIFVLDPVWVMYSKEILTETFFVPLLLGAIMSGYIAIIKLLETWVPESDGYLSKYLPGLSNHPLWERANPLVLMILAGSLMGLSTLFKPITFYAPWAGVMLFLGIFFTSMRTMRLPVDMVKSIVLFFIAAQVFIFGWQFRNYTQHNSLAFTSIQAENMMTGHAAFVLARAENLTHHEAQQRIREKFREEHPEHGDYTFDKLSEAKSGIAAEILFEHTWIYTFSILRGMAISLMDPGRLVVSRTFGDGDRAEIGLTNTIARDGIGGTVNRLFAENPGMVVFMVIHLFYLGLVVLLSVVGFTLMVRRHPIAALSIGLMFLYLLVLGGPSGYARFRMYLLPWMLIFMAYVDFKALFRIRFRELLHGGP